MIFGEKWRQNELEKKIWHTIAFKMQQMKAFHKLHRSYVIVFPVKICFLQFSENPKYSVRRGSSQGSLELGGGGMRHRK